MYLKLKCFPPWTFKRELYVEPDLILINVYIKQNLTSKKLISLINHALKTGIILVWAWIYYVSGIWYICIYNGFYVHA